MTVAGVRRRRFSPAGVRAGGRQDLHAGVYPVGADAQAGRDPVAVRAQARPAEGAREIRTGRRAGASESGAFLLPIARWITRSRSNSETRTGVGVPGRHVEFLSQDAIRVVSREVLKVTAVTKHHVNIPMKVLAETCLLRN